MTIDEAIAHCLDNVEKEMKTCNIDCAKEHEQLAEWLKELKCLKEKELKKVEKTEMMKQFEKKTGKQAMYWTAFGPEISQEYLDVIESKAESYDRMMSDRLTMKELANILKHPVAIENDEGQNTLYFFRSTPHIGQFSDGTQFWSCNRKCRLPRQLVHFNGDWEDSLTLPDNWEATNEKD